MLTQLKLTNEKVKKNKPAVAVVQTSTLDFKSKAAKKSKPAGAPVQFDEKKDNVTSATEADKGNEDDEDEDAKERQERQTSPKKAASAIVSALPSFSKSNNPPSSRITLRRNPPLRDPLPYLTSRSAKST